jgi:hypothetical protein
MKILDGMGEKFYCLDLEKKAFTLLLDSLSKNKIKKFFYVTQPGNAPV